MERTDILFQDETANHKNNPASLEDYNYDKFAKLLPTRHVGMKKPFDFDKMNVEVALSPRL